MGGTHQLPTIPGCVGVGVAMPLPLVVVDVGRVVVVGGTKPTVLTLIIIKPLVTHLINRSPIEDDYSPDVHIGPEPSAVAVQGRVPGIEARERNAIAVRNILAALICLDEVKLVAVAHHAGLCWGRG